MKKRIFLAPTVDVQAGFSYYHTNKFTTSGVIYQFADPSMDNLGYQYNIQSERYYAEGKLLTTCHEYHHPFISAGLGQAKNKASHFQEYPLTTDAVPVDVTFSDHLSNSFSYLVGAGIENELTQNVRLGIAYRWVSLNKVRLGASPYQDSSDSLSKRLNTNDFLAQLSYLG